MNVSFSVCISYAIYSVSSNDFFMQLMAQKDITNMFLCDVLLGAYLAFTGAAHVYDSK